jgi:hypothetical protein
MKKWLIGSIIAVLIGTCPVSTYAADGNFNNALKNLVDKYVQQNYEEKGSNQKDQEKERKKQERKDQEHRDQDRREQERKDQDRRDQDRREQERKDQDRKEQEHREQDRRQHERWEQERREQERIDQERRERERWEQERREQERREQERRQHERWERESSEQEDARYIIHRTAPVIYLAQRAVQFRGYSSGLAIMIAHQQRAHQLFEAGFHQQAIFHSLRARRLAIIIILGNGGKWFGLPANRDEREESYGYIAPRDNELDLRLDINNIGKDDEAIHIMFNLDIN